DMAELDGYNTKLRSSRRTTLEYVVSDLFPRGGDATKASFWSGLRPMTPDGPPLIGRAKYDNLFLNTGHGTLGWTMSCGSGRVLVEGGIEEQAGQVFDNLEAVLAKAGASLANVVKTTVFVKDLGDFARLSGVYERRFAGHKPARSTVQAARLPRDVLVEIEVVA